MSPSAIHDQSRLDGPKVPCIVVEDLDSTSHQSFSSSNFDRDGFLPSDHMPPDQTQHHSNCPQSLPRDPLYFKEVRLGQGGSTGVTPFSFRLAPYTAWTVWFSQIESSFVNIQFYAPLHARLVLLAAKNEPPTFAIHQVFQVISEEALSGNNQNRLQRRMIRESQLLQLQSMHYLEQGSWYLTLVNDIDSTLPLVVNMSAVHNMSTKCPNDCNNHGHCHFGKCKCFPGFLSEDCSDSEYFLHF